jgi:phosphoenolpyruvate carboxylase
MSSSSLEPTLRTNIVFEEKDQALREDVHWLGELVGELVAEQGGEALFDLVEAARRAAIKRREGDSSGLTELQELLHSLAPNAARDFIRAFSTYFQMVNMAEKVHRIRRRREYLTDTTKHQPLSFLDTFTRLREDGHTASDVQQVIDKLSIEPVFTAHPSEATRRTLLRKQQSIARHLVQMLDPYLTPNEVDAIVGQIRLEMTTGWQTAEYPGVRRLSDEAEHILFFLTEVLYRMIPPFYESLESAYNQIFGDSSTRIRVPELIRFSSWIGGDMDGNPTVTAKSIRQTLGRQRSLILDLYYEECGELSRHLSQTEGRSHVAEEILKRSDLYSGHFPKAAHSVPARHGRMPYRKFLRLVQARLQATYDDTAFPYEAPDEFIADIERIADSLRANRGRNAGLFAVRRLLRRVHTFGFHIAALDLRQNALAHRRVIGDALQEPDWLELSSEARTTRIKEALARRESPVGAFTSEGRRTLSVFQSIAYSRRRYGARAIGSYIVRMVSGADDVLSVLLLARWGHLGPKGGAVPLDIAPLFETADELANSSVVMERLLGDEYYREHLRSRGDEQLIVLGYSGGNPDGDIISARWNLDKAQRALAETMARFEASLTFVHVRAGTLSRAGGRVQQITEALPPEAVSNRLRMTEQGETINAKYGLRGIAMRTLEQLTTSLLWAKIYPDRYAGCSERWSVLMDDMSAASSRAFRGLIFESPDFEAYFRAATPIDVIEQLGIAPTRDSANASPIDGLHEIAWSLAWTQSRCLLPAWFGFASGVHAVVARHGLDRLKEAYQEWPLLRFITADVEFALAKADLGIAERYSALAGKSHEHFFSRIRDEYDRSIEAVLALTGQDHILAASETIARSIKLRNPYVDPMSLLQVDLLHRWRTGGRNDDAVLQALIVSVNGITHAMQESG